MKKIPLLLLALFLILSLVLVSCDDTQPTETTEKEELTDPIEFTKGLLFELNEGEESYSLVGAGEFAGGMLAIPNEHEGLPVTAVADEAFKFNRTITGIIFPDSITRIGENAFGWCDSIESITFGNGLTEIHTFAFASSPLLKTVIIPDSVTFIHYTAFWNCSALESIKLGKGITKLGGDIGYEGDITFDGFSDFSGCSSLVNIIVDEDHPTFTTINGSLYSKDKSTIVKYALGKKDLSFSFPDHVAIIDKGAFYDADNLEDIVIPDTVTRVSNWAFQNCSSLNSVIIEDGVDIIERWVFTGCTSLTSIEVDEKNQNYKSISGSLYSKDEKQLIQYALGLSFDSFTVPEGVTEISQSAFSGSPYLTEIILPEGVEAILSGAFESCEKLERISLPSTLSSIESSAFMFSFSLDHIDYNGTVEQWLDIEKSSIWSNGMASEFNVYCTDGSIDQSSEITYN